MSVSSLEQKFINLLGQLDADKTSPGDLFKALGKAITRWTTYDETMFRQKNEIIPTRQELYSRRN